MSSVTGPRPFGARSLVVLLACLALGLVGLSGADQSRAAGVPPTPDEAASKPGPSADGRTADGEGRDCRARDAQAAAAVTSPLTGLPVDGDGSGKPVAVVKVDNTSSARPQVGLDRADLVVEELVEGGLTRLAAFYHSRHPKVVGPVRSMRLTDAGVVLPTEGLLFASGAAPVVERRLKRAGVRMRTEGSPGFSRDSSREVPYNLMLDLAEAVAGLGDVEPPEEYLPFADTSLRRGKAVERFSVSFSSASTTRWKPRGDGWVRANGPVDPADDFAAHNVLVIKARTHNADYDDPGGNPVPVTEFRGKGEAMLFADGRMVRARWHKRGHEGALTLRDSRGRKLSVPAGRTLIELIPRKRGSVHIP